MRVATARAWDRTASTAGSMPIPQHLRNVVIVRRLRTSLIERRRRSPTARRARGSRQRSREIASANRTGRRVFASSSFSNLKRTRSWRGVPSSHAQLHRPNHVGAGFRSPQCVLAAPYLLKQAGVVHVPRSRAACDCRDRFRSRTSRASACMRVRHRASRLAARPCRIDACPPRMPRTLAASATPTRRAVRQNLLRSA